MTQHNRLATPPLSIPNPPATPGQRIQPLPHHVVAQIKSSAVVTSLNGVVLQLVKNSLDAKATKVDVTIDHARGSCVVEDDGHGIVPAEFTLSGSLGRPYCTSKYYAREPLLGRNGTFLASLAAMSLVTITSHHHEHRSHNSITFHHSQAIERQTPASARDQIHGKHGTRVTVRNLFGNLPVRVKQRSMALAQKPEQDRLWAELNKDITALLLSWQGMTSLKVRDGEYRVVLSCNTASSTTTSLTHCVKRSEQQSSPLAFMLNILTQMGFIGIDDWSSWVPVSASTSSVSIRGAISLEPAPSKQGQFITLGNQPLSTGEGHNELFGQINRLFALSSFGTTEDDQDVDHLEKLRRQRDKRFKHDGYTNRQLKARKDIDRHPAFHLRVILSGEDVPQLPIEQLDNDETMLQSIVEVLCAMITQWLAVHHFRPRQPYARRTRPGTASESLGTGTRSLTASAEPQPASSQIFDFQAAEKVATRRPSTAPVRAVNHQHPRTSLTRQISEATQPRAFTQWSRIKSGRANFHDSVASLSLSKSKRFIIRAINEPGDNKSESSAGFDIAPVARGAFNSQENFEDTGAGDDRADGPKDIDQDDTLLWTEPSTGKTYVLNARTGCVVPNLPFKPSFPGAQPFCLMTQADLNKPLRLPPRSTMGTTVQKPFLENVLKTWHNPVFKASEVSITRASIEELDSASRSYDQLHGRCAHAHIDSIFNQAGVSTSAKLSKEGLRRARVIAQVDKKFVLVKMKQLDADDSTGTGPSDLLVLLDQHAADERVRVEGLLEELCTPASHGSDSSSYRSQLGHRARVSSLLLDKPIQFTVSVAEHAHFTTHAARFAAWGILFDTIATTTSSSSRSNKTQHLLSVSCLPPVVAQRCKTDPQILISCLRATVWKYVEDPQLPLAADSIFEKGEWISRLATCPQGLIDMVNSRACRSAIMFNDELSIEECETLVESLAQCHFPFMCAHGRPSMVPLVGLEERVCEDKDYTVFAKSDKKVVEGTGRGFAAAWKTWRGQAGG
ncbi:DNA mismatch repair protein [Coniothyrium glycines]